MGFRTIILHCKHWDFFKNVPELCIPYMYILASKFCSDIDITEKYFNIFHFSLTTTTKQSLTHLISSSFVLVEMVMTL